MSRTKRGQALFDLLGEDPSTTTESLKVPGWWERRTEPGPLRPISGRFEAVADPAEPTPPQQADLGQPALTQPTRPVRFVELDGEYVRFSFAAGTAAIAVFVAAVALVVAFELGSRSGEKRGLAAGYQQGQAAYQDGTPSEIEAAQSEPPATHMVEDLLIEAG